MMGPLFAVSLLSLFSGDWITPTLAIAGAAFAFLGARNLPGKQAGPLARLASRASVLLQHLQSLGMPALAPIVRELAQGNFAALPAAVHAFLDQLDDKTQRQNILDALFAAQLARQIKDPILREALLNKLAAAGVITPHTHDAPHSD